MTLKWEGIALPYVEIHKDASFRHVAKLRNIITMSLRYVSNLR